MAINEVNNNEILNQIPNFLLNGIKNELENKYQEIKNDLIKRLDTDKDTIIAGIALNFYRSMNVERFGENIRIEIKTESLQKPC